MEFYKVFWPEIGRNLVDSLNFSYCHGELSTTQKEAVITLIEKKNQDRRLIKNWRPICLVNFDVKIGSKAISKRLEKVLPHIIHYTYDQNALVEGRTIFDAVRTINDVTGRMFWNEVVNLFRDQLKISKDFVITDAIFGLSNKETYSSLINYIILEGKSIVMRGPMD